MSVFANMKVTSKLLLLLVVMLVGFAAIGATYVAVLNAEKVARTHVRNTSRFRVQIEEVNHDLQEALTRQRDFLLNKHLEDLERFEVLMSKARDALSDLETKAPNDQLKQLIAPLNKQLVNFHAAVYQLTETQLALGLDEDSGLQGVMRNAAQELEQALTTFLTQERSNTMQDPTFAWSAEVLNAQLLGEKLHTSLLQMRGHEKDYLQRAQVDDKYVSRMAEEQETFRRILEEVEFTPNRKATFSGLLATYQNRFGELVEAMGKLQQDRTAVDSASAIIIPDLQHMVRMTQQAAEANQIALEAQRNRLTKVFILVLGGSTVVVALIVLFLGRGIINPLRHLQATVRQVTEGETTARARLFRGDEIGTLANAFDNLLDERVTYLAEAERERAARLAEAEQENEALNASVVVLLQAVARLSQRDLTIKVPVAEDVTGPVSDALNLLTDETAKVLAEVTRISDAVATASRSVKSQSDTVVDLASRERQQVTQTADELAAAAEAMNEIATLAQTCNTTAENAIQKTQMALETVTGTVTGINATRDTIRETEKRIKRLGERSQEISGAVNLINNIAERTHILALNASMHAASAGEAGRGFAVVADEVQRLAENARQATEQIASLVGNIQTETMDTVTTMNTVISQVIEGSRLAEQAGEQMRETQQTTTELVDSVRQISEGSQTQAKISNELRHRAGQIEDSTLQTSRQLEAQGVQTNQLLSYAIQLVGAVRVFRLPDQLSQESAEIEQIVVSEAAIENEDAIEIVGF